MLGPLNPNRKSPQKPTPETGSDDKATPRPLNACISYVIDLVESIRPKFDEENWTGDIVNSYPLPYVNKPHTPHVALSWCFPRLVSSMYE